MADILGSIANSSVIKGNKSMLNKKVPVYANENLKNSASICLPVFCDLKVIYLCEKNE